MESLKPCPFCGGEANISKVFGRAGVVCEGCEANMRSVAICGDGEDVIKVWNTRAKPSTGTEELIDKIDQVIMEDVSEDCRAYREGISERIEKVIREYKPSIDIDAVMEEIKKYLREQIHIAYVKKILTRHFQDKSGLSEEVLAFAERMQYKLEKNKHKACPEMNPDGKSIRGWDDCSVSWLLSRIEDEIIEFEEAFFEREDIEDAKNECADIGNFAMMLFDNLSKEK